MTYLEAVGYWGSWASLISIPLTVATLLLAKSVRDAVIASRFQQRLASLVSAMREAEMKANIKQLTAEIKVLVHAFETSYSWFDLRFSSRVNKAYVEAKKQAEAPSPDIKVLQGLLINLRTLHAEVTP
ncbi:hypothetical protein [Massilia rhizosphaerae]|uniref:hypothetical protein n=1 Tax=Massilia rhizosphaerae TaxID=2784389 RepID=UPI0018DBEC9A|nr:hypothetical protein [Massilia rhizosphaerae]